MIPLAEPISITPPPLTDASGNVRTFNPIIISGGIDYSVMYDNTRQIATANIKQVNRSVVLWKGPDYVNAGEWTDVQTDMRLSGILGENPAATISGMFHTLGF